MSERDGPALSGSLTTAAGPGGDRVPAFGWIVWFTRISAYLFALSTLLQAVLAGLFVTGDVDMLTWHDVNAQVNSTLLFFVFLGALFVWRPAHGPVWPIWSTVALFVLIEAQKTIGYLRMVDLHIPLGALLLGFSMLLAGWATGLRLYRVPPEVLAAAKEAKARKAAVKAARSQRSSAARAARGARR